MLGYIKSHSNYRLQTRHQVTNDGVIYERDISTVGGVNSFATGQSTIYQSGNFVILVNNTTSASRHIKKKEWLASGNDSDTWDINTLSAYTSDINGSVEKSIMLKNDFMDLRSFAYYGSLSDLVQNTVTKIISTYPYELYKSNVEFVSGSTTYYQISNPGNIDIHNITSNGSQANNNLGHFYDGGYENYAIYLETESGTPFTWSATTVSGIDCPKPNVVFSNILLNSTTTGNIEIKAYWDESLNVKYITTSNINFHIRPRMDKPYYEDFVDGLDLFGKCLIGIYSGIKNTAKFQILTETDRGTTKSTISLTFPTGDGGYNLGSDTIAMRRYISELGNVSLSYDNLYTDNLYRLMTHDSLKNLDWTRNFNGNDDDYDNEYMYNGQKFASVIRIMGYTFDQEKAYVDSIGNVNTITYSNIDNISDYFLTDSLETDGWMVNTIYPYELTVYSGNTNVTNNQIWSQGIQSGDTITRKFSEITTEIITPYVHFENPYYTACSGGVSTNFEIDDYSGQTYYVDGKVVYNILKDYYTESEYSIPDINNEFMKRFKINSRYILKKKGTIEGIESLLSLFGFRSKRWCELNKFISSGASQYDFDVQEYVQFAPPIDDSYDNVHDEWRINWLNSCKTIPYDTPSYISGKYIDYQGLPVAYRDLDDTRKLYPFFESSGIYDGGMYYQMNGGWLGYLPYRFDVDDRILLQDSDKSIRVETMRNIKMVKDMEELLSQPSSDLFNGIIYYVTKISEKYALISGFPYKLKEEFVSGNTEYYFEALVYGASISIGNVLYTDNVTVSHVGGTFRSYDLNLYKNGSIIRIYYTGNPTAAFYTIPTEYYNPEAATQPLNPTGIENYTSYIFINGQYPGSDDSSHYFKLVDINELDRIGEGFWQKIDSDSSEYKIINSIIDKTDGNNPHSGNYGYDNGQEYINRFNQLFKYASENRLFNETCFTDVDSTYDEIDSYGFNTSGFTDSKVHAFVDREKSNGNIVTYNLNSKTSLSGLTFYPSVSANTSMDGVTSQIMNTKRFDITFYIGGSDGTVYSKKNQEKIKYIQSKIMPYVEQMIPSTSIVNVNFSTS